jgi:hypothetical protein
VTDPGVAVAAVIESEAERDVAAAEAAVKSAAMEATTVTPKPPQAFAAECATVPSAATAVGAVIALRNMTTSLEQCSAA